MNEPVLYGFKVSDENLESPMEYISHHLIGGNPDDPEHGFSATAEIAELCFLTQFAELAKKAEGNFLFVRKAPTCDTRRQFEGGIKWRMIGRFSIAKLKEKKNA